MGLLGLLSILALAYALSRNRRAIKPSLVLWGLGLQILLAVLVLKTPFGGVFQAIGGAINRMMQLAEDGSIFVFGDLGKSDGPLGIVLAFQILPLIVFVSSLFAVLYYLGIMQWVVRGIAIVMQRVLGASGAESLNVAANIFMGQSEAPLTIRPYLSRLTNSELMTVMTGGMATISGALLVAYVRIGGVPVEHLLTAVVMTAPGSHLDGQDARARNRNAGDLRPRAHRHRQLRRQRHRRRRAWSERGPLPRAERWRRVDCLRRP